MTMLFVGMVPPATGKALSQLALDKLPKPFGMRLDRCGYWARPGVGWLAPSKLPRELARLHQYVHKQVVSLGVSLESRPYKPHVTVWKKLSGAWVCSRPPAVNWPVSHLYLVRSFLCPDGPRYRSVAGWSLEAGCRAIFRAEH